MSNTNTVSSSSESIGLLLRDKLEEALSELKPLEELKLSDVSVTVIIGGTFLPKVLRLIDDICSSAILVHGGLVAGLLFVTYVPSEKFTVEEAVRDLSRVLFELLPYFVPSGDERFPCLALTVVVDAENQDAVNALVERGFDKREISTEEGKAMLLFKNVVGKVKLSLDAIVSAVRHIVQSYTTLRTKQ